MKRFALMGAAGYVAPRHMKAIRDTGNLLIAALDPNDSVGIIDSYFPDAHFFTEFERFDRHLDKLRRAGPSERVDIISICTPNYLHDAHMRFALRSGADAICEKPLVLNPWNLDGVAQLEQDTGRRVNAILQLRLHPSIMALQERIRAADRGTKHEVDLTYVTPRGRWYLQSWKGDDHKSGGIMSNIGVHLFDLLRFLFGPLQMNRVHLREVTRAAGYLEFERARVRWFLSIDGDDVPRAQTRGEAHTYRSITVDGEEVEFSGGFTDLHARSYEEILAGRGFGLADNRDTIEMVSAIREASISPLVGDYHPMVDKAA